jgi:hypothetical protein
MSTQPLILIEFNELCPHLLDRWIESGDLPNFRRLRDTSTVCVTEADELASPYLEPWIQWYSLHTGLPFKQHGVFRLSEGASRPYESVFDLLLRRGLQVINFSSMNCKGFERSGSVFLPDPWNDSEHAFPSELEVFRGFVAKAIQEQKAANWSVRELFAVARFLLAHGLKPATVMVAVTQLVDEWTSSSPKGWQRVHVLDRILLDVFLHYYRRQRPQFATFFSNSTAHLQHAYWRFLEPERFSEPTNDRDRAAYSGAVKYGYQAMDRLLAPIMDTATRTGASVMFATALSQQAYLAYEGRGGRHYYRPFDLQKLFARLGVTPRDVQPVMAHQFIVTFATHEERKAAQASIESLRVGDKQLFDVADGDAPTKLIFGAQVYSPLAADATIEYTRNGAPVREPFFTHFYELEATKSGGHHPDGCFWIQTGRHQRVASKVSILDIAPTILRHFGMDGGPMGGRPLSLNA